MLKKTNVLSFLEDPKPTEDKKGVILESEAVAKENDSPDKKKVVLKSKQNTKTASPKASITKVQKKVKEEKKETPVINQRKKTVHLSTEVHKVLRLYCFTEDKSHQEVVSELIMTHLTK